MREKGSLCALCNAIFEDCNNLQFTNQKKREREMGGATGKLVWVLLVMCSSWLIAAVQAQQPARTDPIEVAALEAILGRWNKTTSPLWSMSGEPCRGVPVDGSTDLDGNPKNNPGIKCDCSYNSGTVCHITQLRVYALNVVGQIPAELQNLTYLTYLNLDQNYLSGPIPSFIGQLTALTELHVGFNPLSGSLPKELGNLTNLNLLYTDSAGLSGPFPSTLSRLKNLKLLRASDNNFTGTIPDFIGSLSNLEDLVLRNCKISGDLGAVDFSKDLSFNNISGNVPKSILNLQKLIFLFLGNNSLTGELPDGISPSLTNLDFSYNQLTGSFPSWVTQNNLQFNRSIRVSDNTMYELDSTNLGDSSYYVTSQTRWGVSNVGKLFQAPNDNKIIHSGEKIQNAVDSELFQTARMSPSSLRYYGLGLENGNYTGELKEKDFNIRKMAGGKSFTAVYKSYTTTVSKNFLEIHLFWAGKGTCCIPIQGYYGPLISALSITPNFTPTVRNGVPKRKSKAGAIAGISIGASVVGLAALFGIFMFIKKRRRLAQQQGELYNLVGRPDVFSNAQLKVVAVKQLSQSSQQGKSQFVTEVATISSVQHRNLVKLYGCCIDSNTPLLVYEYLENGSLDQALFADGRFNLGWSTRFDIILGIARGLSYLHEEANVRIVHRDIKASNILLDPDLTPKISDFGLAKLYDEKKTHVNTKVAGTFGYLAPEYAMRGHLTEKVDVFSFGVVALETVAGRSNTDYSLVEDKKYLFEWAWGLYEREQVLGIVDPRLEEIDEEEVLRVISISFLCTQGSPHQRPPMSRVVAMLTGDIPVSDVMAKPNYIIELQLRGRNSSHVTTGYSGSIADELSGQRETSPLTPSLEISREIIDDGR
uniref:non-specific serine/threonine protein kinase n=1 Tax=Oryza meridionalis TaxID=40149 RepID=A0A0E0EJ17_9ORYZ